jgi:hypothetical protein
MTIDLDQLAKDVAERIGNTRYPDSYGGNFTPLFNLNSCCGDDAVRSARTVLGESLAPLIEENRLCIEWLRAILKDPSRNESLAIGLREFLKDKKP